MNYKEILENNLTEGKSNFYYRLEEKFSKSILFSSAQAIKSISDAVQRGDDFDFDTFNSTMKSLTALKKKLVKVKKDKS